MAYIGRKPVELVVVDEMPTTVLAPDITTKHENLHSIESLCAVTHHHYVKADEEEVKFSESMMRVIQAIHQTCESIEQAGTIRIELPASMGVPDNWQRVVASIIKKAKVHPNPEALRLITRATTGDLKELYITTDITPQGDKKHFVYGRFQAGLPKDVPTICTDATTKPADLEAATGMMVHDQTPTGHLDVVQPVRHILL